MILPRYKFSSRPVPIADEEDVRSLSYDDAGPTFLSSEFVDFSRAEFELDE
jgi:hypothetical protein